MKDKCSTNSDFEFNRIKNPSITSHYGALAMGQTELVEKSQSTISEAACKHQFGFLGARPKGVAIPEECFTCERMLDCTISKPKNTLPTVEVKEVKPVEVEEEKKTLEVTEEASQEATEEVTEEIVEPESFEESVDEDQEPVMVIEEVEDKASEAQQENTGETAPNRIKDQVTKRIGQILKLRIPKFRVRTEDAETTNETAATPSDREFRVESPGRLYNQWSGTVFINKDVLESWEKKIREVELETEKGRITICKAHPAKDLDPQVIQIPDKVKWTLRVEDGADIIVRPAQ
jgi:hypothetical protein